jgi:NADPH:quinone reductase
MSEDYRLVVRATGGPEVIEREDIAVAAPGPGEAVVRHTAIGLNFIDTYHRSGLYKLALPSGLGNEAAGVVEAIGAGVTGLRVGTRVAYAGGPLGAYATVRAMPADLLVPLPDAIDGRIAAAVMLKGMTADMLTGACGKIHQGQTVLVHAANGGVGSIAVQWLKAIDATVIAHAGSAEKAARATALGADHALSCPFDRLAEQVRAITGGRGVDVVFDGVGKDSFDASIGALARRGLLISYGNASGAVPPFAPLLLAQHGSLFLTRPMVFDYIASALERRASAYRLFDMITGGRIAVEIGQSFALADAADAHRALEDRRTTGSTVLIP